MWESILCKLFVTYITFMFFQSFCDTFHIDIFSNIFIFDVLFWIWKLSCLFLIAYQFCYLIQNLQKVILEFSNFWILTEIAFLKVWVIVVQKNGFIVIIEEVFVEVLDSNIVMKMGAFDRYLKIYNCILKPTL